MGLSIYSYTGTWRSGAVSDRDMQIHRRLYPKRLPVRASYRGNRSPFRPIASSPDVSCSPGLKVPSPELKVQRGDVSTFLSLN